MDELTPRQLFIQKRAELYTSISQVSCLKLHGTTSDILQNIFELTEMIKIVNNNFEALATRNQEIEIFSGLWLDLSDTGKSNIVVKEN